MPLSDFVKLIICCVVFTQKGDTKTYRFVAIIHRESRLVLTVFIVIAVTVALVVVSRTVPVLAPPPAYPVKYHHINMMVNFINFIKKTMIVVYRRQHHVETWPWCCKPSTAAMIACEPDSASGCVCRNDRNLKAAAYRLRQTGCVLAPADWRCWTT